MRSLTCPVGGVRVLLAALDSLHGVCQGGTSFGPIKQGSVEGMDKNFRGCNRHRPQGHQGALGAGSQKGPGQSHDTICCHFAAGLLVRPATTERHGRRVIKSGSFQDFNGITFHT